MFHCDTFCDSENRTPIYQSYRLQTKPGSNQQQQAGLRGQTHGPNRGRVKHKYTFYFKDFHTTRAEPSTSEQVQVSHAVSQFKFLSTSLSVQIIQYKSLKGDREGQDAETVISMTGHPYGEEQTC